LRRRAIPRTELFLSFRLVRTREALSGAAPVGESKGQSLVVWCANQVVQLFLDRKRSCLRYPFPKIQVDVPTAPKSIHRIWVRGQLSKAHSQKDAQRLPVIRKELLPEVVVHFRDPMDVIFLG